MKAVRDRTSASDGRIIIAGTGRAGTTFLVQLFTALGFNTGFSLAQALEGIDEISHAGLEKPLVDEANPYVIKSPWFADHLADALETDALRIHAAIIPTRELSAAALSRCRVYDEAQKRGLDPLAQPGSLWHTREPAQQEAILARQFYKTVFPLIRHGVPIYFMEFPRLAADPSYLFAKMEGLMRDHGVSSAAFEQAHQAVARLDYIHAF